MTLQNPAEKETGEAEKALMNPSLFFCLYSRRMKLSWQESIILKQGYIYMSTAQCSGVQAYKIMQYLFHNDGGFSLLSFLVTLSLTHRHMYLWAR